MSAHSGTEMPEAPVTTPGPPPPRMVVVGLAPSPLRERVAVTKLRLTGPPPQRHGEVAVKLEGEPLLLAADPRTYRQRGCVDLRTGWATSPRGNLRPTSGLAPVSAGGRPYPADHSATREPARAGGALAEQRRSRGRSVGRCVCAARRDHSALAGRCGRSRYDHHLSSIAAKPGRCPRGGGPAT